VEARVAILIPAFQAQSTISETLSSIPDLDWVQVIVVDDGSSEPLQVSHSFDQAQFDLFRNPENQGVNSTMLQASMQMQDSVEYLIELDADDQLVPGAIEKMVSLLDSNPCLDLAWGDLMIKGDQDYVRCYGTYFDPWLTRLKNPISCSTMMRRTSWVAAGGSWGNNRLQHQDWYMWLSFARLNAKGGHIGQPALIYNMGATGLHRSRKHLTGERRALTLAEFTDLKPWKMFWRSACPWSLRLALLLATTIPVGDFRRARLKSAVLALLWAKDVASFKGRMREFWTG